MKVLFVCNMNQMRSPTAEVIFKDHPHLDVRSAGVYSEAAVTIDRDLLAWTDIIFVMEEGQQDIIWNRFGDLIQRKRIICLDIPDVYDYMDPILVLILKHRVKEHLARLNIPDP